MSNSKTITDRVAGYLLMLIVVMAAIYAVSTVVNKFVGNDRSWGFENSKLKMTCVVAKVEGQILMSCVPSKWLNEDKK